MREEVVYSSCPEMRDRRGHERQPAHTARSELRIRGPASARHRLRAADGRQQ